MRTIRFLVASLVALTITGCESQSEKAAKLQNAQVLRQSVVEKHKATINDPLSLVPDWYRDRSRVIVLLDEDNPNQGNPFDVWKINELHISILIAGLFLYAFYGVLIQTAANRDYSNEPYGMLFFVGALLVPEVLAIPIHFVLAIVLNIVGGKAYFVPHGFIAFWLHVVVMLTPVFLLVPYLLSKSAAKDGKSRQDTSPIISGGQVRWRRIRRAALKAFIVAIATGIGSKFGGLIGAALAAVVATILGLSIDQDSSSSGSH